MIQGLQPHHLYTTHIGQSGGRGLSPRLWSRHTKTMNNPDGEAGAILVGDDFTNFGQIAPSTSGTTAYTAHGGYGAYVDTATSAASIKQIATKSGGVVRFATSGTDNHECWLTSGGNSGVLGAISDTAGDDRLTIFEARVLFGQVSDDHNFFVGLSEEGLAAADTISDAGALASKDLIGFSVQESDGNALDFVYRKAGQSLQTKITGVQTLEADTWYKVGFVYDPTAPASERIAVFVDNVEQSTYVTKTNIEAATFPDGEELAFLAGGKTGAGADKQMEVDWWNFYQSG